MRNLLLCSLLSLLLAGCIDSLGVGSECASQMAAVRLREGSPDEYHEGNRSQLWIYYDKRITYEFSWGSGGEGCEVKGPEPFRYRAPPGTEPAPQL